MVAKSVKPNSDKLNLSRITMRRVHDLLPYANNARTHTDDQVRQVAASIKEFGWTNPVIVHGDTIIAGHARVAAARQLNLDEIPCIDRSDMSEAQWKAYVLADNRLAQNAGWDEGLLKLELMELDSLDFNLDLIGFDEKELSKLLQPEPDEGLTDPDEVPEDVEPVTQPGDLWVLGEHRLLCGDATKAEDVEYLLDGAKPFIMVTDPPYGISVVPRAGKIGGSVLATNKTYKPVANDDRPFDPRPHLAYTPVSVMFGANYFADKLPLGQWAVWDKARPGGTTFSEAELIWTSMTGKQVRVYRHTWHGMTRQGAHEERTHPTQKPVDLIMELIGDAESVYDPFLGSGTTLIAAQRQHRKGYFIEIDPHYVDVAVTRWENFTGQKAERIAKANA